MSSVAAAAQRRAIALEDLKATASQLSTRYGVENPIADIDCTYVHLENPARENSATYQALTAEMYAGLAKLFENCLAAVTPLG